MSMRNRLNRESLFNSMLALSMLALSAGLLVSLTGCSKSEDRTAQLQPGEKTETTTTSTATGTEDAATKPAGPTSANPNGQIKMPSAPGGDLISSTGLMNSGPIVNPEGLAPVIAAEKKIDLAHMPDSLTICFVGTTPITVGDYRRQFRTEEEAVRAQLSVNKPMLDALLFDAKKKNISLTEDEKRRLVETAHKARSATGGALDKFLKDSHMTEAQFDQHVLNVGLATKNASYQIQQTLLAQLVDRELVCDAARASGFGTAAFNRYIEMKKLPQYDLALKVSNLTAEQMKDEVIKAELMRLMVDKIMRQSPPNEATMQKFYKDNQKQFKHGERIRMSQILVAAPTEDHPPMESVRTQLKKQHAQWDDGQLDAQEKITIAELQKKAEGILAHALNGEDFAKLANDYTEDVTAKKAQTGGDMGWQERSVLVPEFAKKVWPLPAGSVCPQVIPSPFGFHIIKVTGKEGPGQLTYEECREALKQLLWQQNSYDAVKTWVEKKIKTTQIAVAPEFKSFAPTQHTN